LLHQHRAAYDLYDKKEWGGLKFVDGGENAKNKITEIDNKTIKECKEIYTNSQNVTERLKKFNNIDSQKLYYPPSLIGKYKCNDFEDYILSVGHLDSINRVDLIIRSLKFCDEKIKAKIVGVGPEIENLKKLAGELEVSSRVSFLGCVKDEDLIELYANAFAVCFLPFNEDYGYITIEAFLSKKPVITAVDSRGPLEFVKSDVNGLITEPIPEDLGASIQKLYNNKKQCREFGIRGYDTVKDITWDTVIDKLTETIR
jgi:glycosyltransferase involved in cell wall biosynthesis